MNELASTPWVDRTMRSVWERLKGIVPSDEWLPLLAPGRRFAVEELGCGHYGCVMPTGAPDIVFKLTSDVAEARFVAMAKTVRPKQWYEGVVEYHGLYHIHDSTFRNRPLFVLWRQEAYDVGILTALVGGWSTSTSVARLAPRFDDYSQRELKKEALPLLDQFKDEATVARNYILPRLRSLAQGEPATIGRGKTVTTREDFLKAVWDSYERAEYQQITVRNKWTYREEEVFGAPKWVKGIYRTGVALANCHAISDHLENTAGIYLVGRAFGNVMDDGLLMADVHLNNIGFNSDNELLITDPGHVVEFHPRWATLPDIQDV